MANKKPLAVMQWDGQQFHPADSIDREALRNLKPFQYVELHSLRPRSSKQNRYAHALMHIGADNAPEDSNWTEELIKQAVKLRGGFVTGHLHKLDGDIETVYRSTADFSVDEMTRFIDLLIDYIVTTVAPGIDPDLLRAEAERAVAPYNTKRKAA